MAQLANLLVFLGLDSAKFTSGLDDATKKSEAFSRQQQRIANQSKASADALFSRLAGVAAGLVTIQGLLGLFQKADALADLAGAFDTTAGAVLQAGKALELAGGRAEDVSKIWSKLTVAQQGAIDGSDKLRDAFAAIGVSAKEVQNLNPDELFQRVAEQLAGIEDPTLRNAKALELLGKSAKGIDWKQYVEEYKGVADPALNAALEEAAMAWDNIRKGAQATFEFLIKLIAPLSYLINAFAKIKAIQSGPVDYGGEGFDSAFVGTAPSPELSPAVAKVEDDRQKKIKEKLAAAKGSGYKIESPEDAAVRAAKEQTGIQERQFQIEKARLLLSGQRVFNSDLDNKIQDEILKSNDTILKLEDQRSKASSAIKYGNEEAKRSKKIEVDNINKQIASEKELSAIRLKNLAEEDARIRSFEFGWDQAYRKLIENNERASLKAAQVFGVLESGFDQLLDTITGKSKKSFADLTLSILQDLVKIELKAQAISALKGAGGFGGIGSAIGGFFGGGGGPDVSSLAGYSLFADGGDLPPGGRGIVGEEGMEKIESLPSGGTRITPLGGERGGSTNYYGPVINSLNAIDTQTGLQFLIKNKEAVYAANQSAQRSLPVTR